LHVGVEVGVRKAAFHPPVRHGRGLAPVSSVLQSTRRLVVTSWTISSADMRLSAAFLTSFLVDWCFNFTRSVMYVLIVSSM